MLIPLVALVVLAVTRGRRRWPRTCRSPTTQVPREVARTVGPSRRGRAHPVQRAKVALAVVAVIAGMVGIAGHCRVRQAPAQRRRAGGVGQRLVRRQDLSPRSSGDRVAGLRLCLSWMPKGRRRCGEWCRLPGATAGGACVRLQTGYVRQLRVGIAVGAALLLAWFAGRGVVVCCSPPWGRQRQLGRLPILTALIVAAGRGALVVTLLPNRRPELSSWSACCHRDRPVRSRSGCSPVRHGDAGLPVRSTHAWIEASGSHWHLGSTASRCGWWC